MRWGQMGAKGMMAIRKRKWSVATADDALGEVKAYALEIVDGCLVFKGAGGTVEVAYASGQWRAAVEIED